ncbi:MAG: Na(+)-translocating NADH-quinone reductase subunit A [Bacteroidaceae bacterium]|nr:Na(+)-translocating NADH-quinone reductase subunit A [Bacteroidaceae bacterium]
MERTYKLKKGLDVRLAGEAAQTLAKAAVSSLYAVRPADFHGITPKPCVKPGDKVRAGDPLFTDKATERIHVASPVSGTVKEIVRGERRKILHITVEPSDNQVFADYGTADAATIGREELIDLLLRAGLFAFIRQRPYDVVANPDDAPKALFVSAFSKMPLAADFAFAIQGREAHFKNGLKALAKLAPVFLGISPEQTGCAWVPTEGCEVNVFDGPNPSGNVGVQINHVSPVNKGEIVWTLGAEEVAFVGELLETGHVNLTRRIAVAGSEVIRPEYVETPIGASLSAILKDNVTNSEHNQRVIDGNPLTGRKASADDFLGARTTEVCVLPEGDDRHEVLGWIMPRLKEFSANRSYLSWLLGKNKAYNLDCRIKGGERHMIMSGEYDRVFPMDIYAGYLVKAIITGDIDQQEALGIYEVAPEDFAVAEFVCSSKLELQHIVRQGLDALRKENA